MKADAILSKVIATLKSRGEENSYDSDEERSAPRIAELFNVMTGKNFTAADVWNHMIALKLVRLRQQAEKGSDVSDSIIDLIGYVALLGEELTALDAAGWTKWGGAGAWPNDSDNVGVEVNFASGSTAKGVVADFNWSWSEVEEEANIVAYRFVDVWIDWDGKNKYPLLRESAEVDVTYRRGETETGQVRDFNWIHFGYNSDIVKYRVL